MSDKTMRDLTSGSAVAAGDLFISRQGADTVDKSVTATQLKTFVSPQKVTDLVFSGRTDAAVGWTSQPAAETVLLGASRTITQFDTTSFTQARVVAQITTAGTTGAKLYLKYKTVASGYSAVVANFTDLIPSASGADIGGSTGVKASVWVDIPAGGIGDMYLAVCGILGNGTDSPQLGAVRVQFR